MVTFARFDGSFVPYTKRPVLRRNAALFVDGRSRNSALGRVALQKSVFLPGGPCTGKQCGDSCGPGLACTGPSGTCVDATTVTCN